MSLKSVGWHCFCNLSDSAVGQPWNSNEIKVGSTMLLLGSDGDKTISPIEWARKSNTIPWEILCSFKNRLPKVQVD